MIRFLFASIGVLLISSSCTHYTADLEPAADADKAATLEEAARARVDGVSMVAQATEWPGSQPIETEVTPVRVRIENNSGQPLQLRYRAFALVNLEGERYAALPPFRIRGAALEPVLVEDYDPIAEPGFIYDDYFELAPIYDPIYDMDVYTDPWVYDYSYYDTYWARIPLPTTEMLRLALPEGVLSSGGQLEGWIYFERIPKNFSQVTFRADLINAKTGRIFGEIRIPFTVE
jgi:hypothetical protein